MTYQHYSSLGWPEAPISADAHTNFLTRLKERIGPGTRRMGRGGADAMSLLGAQGTVSQLSWQIGSHSFAHHHLVQLMFQEFSIEHPPRDES